MKKWVSLLTLAILIMVSCKIFAENDLFSQMADWLQGEIEETASTVSEESQVEDDFEVAAQNGRLTLEVKKSGNEIKIIDELSGASWTSKPEDKVDESFLPELVIKDLRSLFILNYSDERGMQINKTNPINEDAKVTSKDIDGGRRLTFDMKEIKIKIILDLVLGEDYLEVKIGRKGIVEYGKNKVVDIEMLPYFGAATSSDNGYLILPEGSGGLVHFSRPRQQSANNFSEYVYGGNEFAFESAIDRDTMDNSKVMIPVIGMVKNSSGYLGVITEGDESAKVNVSPSGFVLDLYRTSVTFIVRNQYRFRARWAEYVDALEEAPLLCSRAMRYYFLDKNEADYIGLARKYSVYLTEEKGIEPVTDDAAMQVRIFGGTSVKALFGTNYIASTTFKQAQEILTELKKAGVKNINATLVGWSAGGYSLKLPEKLPAEKRLGGNDGLKQLAEYCRKNSIRLTVEENYLDAYKGRKGFSSIRDTIRGLDKLPLTIGDGRYLLNPVYSYEKFAVNEMSEIGRLGIRGSEIKYMGDLVLVDRNRKHPLTRLEFVDRWLKLAGLARSKTGYVLSNGGNAYVLGHVDGITGFNLNDSANEMVDETVPFYEIAVHGITPYYAEPGNLRSDQEREFLKLIEYGALPSYEVTYGSTSDLKQTNYNTLFSSKFSQWKKDITEEYVKVCRDLGYLQSQKIVSHKQLSFGVMETGYEDGTRIIVNYNDKPYFTDGMKIDALDYKVIKGGIR